MADGPGGEEVGRVAVKAVPDVSEFAADLKRDLRKIMKQVGDLKIKVTLDTDGLNEEVKKIKKRTSKEKVEFDTSLNGDGLTRETRKVRLIAQKLVGAIKTTVTVNIPASLAIIKAQMAVIQKGFKGYSIKIPIELVGWTKVLAILGLISAVALGTQNIIGGIGGALATAGGLLATLPAIAIAAGAGIAALVVGFQGMGEALSNSGDVKKFEESLKNLTPSAQATARALAEWRQPLKDIQVATQEALFQDMAFHVNTLKRLLPGIQKMLVGTAGGIREMGQEWARMASSEQSVKDMDTIGTNVTRAWKGARTVMADVGQALRDMAVVGSTVLPDMGRGAASLAEKFRIFISDARESGKLKEWIESAIAAMKQLGRIIANVWNTFASIREAMSNGEGFLDILERITGKMEAFAGSKEGQKFFKDLGTIMRETLDVAIDVFSAIGKAVKSFLSPAMPFLRAFIQGLGKFLVGALKAVEGPLASFGRFLSENKAVMVPLAIALLSLVTAFKLLSTVATGINNLHKAMLGIKSAGTIMKNALVGVEGNGGLKKLVKGLATTTAKVVSSAATWVATWAKSALFAARYFTMIAVTAIKNFARMAATAIVHMVRMAAAWVANLIRMAAATLLQVGIIVAAWIPQLVAMVTRTITQLVIMSAAWVMHWARMAAVALANAARMALAWIIAMGPIAWVIAAIVALVALIIMNWDTIVQVTTDVWNAVWKFVSDVISAIASWVGDRINDIISFFGMLGSLPGRVKNWFLQMSRGAIEKLLELVEWVKSLPGKILGALGDLGNLLVNAGKAIINGLLKGLKAAWDAVSGWVSDVAGWISDLKGPLPYDRRLLIPAGHAIMEGLQKGLEDGFVPVMRFVSKVAPQLARSLENADIGSTWSDNVMAGAPEVMAAMKKISGAGEDLGAEWRSTMETGDLSSVSDKVAEALEGWKVEMDGQKVAKISRKHNSADLRRR
jgi:phage-related protein